MQRISLKKQMRNWMESGRKLVILLKSYEEMTSISFTELSRQVSFCRAFFGNNKRVKLESARSVLICKIAVWKCKNNVWHWNNKSNIHGSIERQALATLDAASAQKV